MSKAKIENGVLSFIQAGYARDNTLPAADTVQFLVATGEDLVSPEKYAILVTVGEVVPVAGSYYHAMVDITVISPLTTGWRSGRDQLSRFVEAVFPRAVPPNPPVNNAHLSSHIATATSNRYTARGYYPGTVRTLPTEGETHWHVIHPLTVGLYHNDPAPPVPSGNISLVY